MLGDRASASSSTLPEPNSVAGRGRASGTISAAAHVEIDGLGQADRLLQPVFG